MGDVWGSNPGAGGSTSTVDTIEPDDTNTIVVTPNPGVGNVTLGVTPNIFLSGLGDPVAAIDSFGGGPSKTLTQNNAAFLAAYNALGGASGHGVISFGCGVYSVGNCTPITVPGYVIRAGGKGATILSFTGTGDCLNLHEATWRGSNEGLSGPSGCVVQGMTIDGTGATGAATGLNFGDLPWSMIDDVQIRNFTHSGSYGFYFNNLVGHCERLRITGCDSHNNANDVQFDVNSGSYNGSTIYNSGTTYTTGQTVWSGNFNYSSIAGSTGNAPSGGATSNAFWTYIGTSTAIASYDYSFIEMSFISNVNQNGLVLNNGVQLYGCFLKLEGNFIGGTGSNSGAVISVLGSGGSSFSASGSSILASSLHISVEADGSGIAHQTINFGSALNIIEAIGKVDFLNVHTTFTAANPGYFAFRLYGPVSGDSQLYSTPYGNRVINVTTTATASPGQTLLCSGTFTVTLPAVTSGFLLSAPTIVKNVGSGVITVIPTTGTIDGQPSIILNQQYQAYAFAYGSTWSIVWGYNENPLIAPVAGNLSSNTSLVANTLTTIFSLSLGLGTWIINYGASVGVVSQFSQPAITVALGTAAGTVGGQFSSESSVPATTNNPLVKLSCCAVVTVTTAGTVLLQGQSNETDIFEHTTAQGTFAGVTGYTAVKVG